MKKQFLLKKYFRCKTFVGISSLIAIVGLSFTISSCAQPTSTTIKSLFKPDKNGFVIDNNDINKSQFLSTIFEQNEAFKSFLDSAMGQILVSFYEDSPQKQLRNKISDWKKEINKSWNDKVQSFRDQFRNDYQVRLQTDVLDENGGSEKSWKDNELYKKVLEDFQNLVFTNNYLNVVEKNGVIITQPSKSHLQDPSNWTNIKFTNQKKSEKKYIIDDVVSPLNSLDNNEQMFADIQDYLATQWVEQENPNLVSYLLFAHETPKVGFNSLINEDLVSSPTASYEFQFFNPIDKNNTKISPTFSFCDMWTQGMGTFIDRNEFINNASTSIGAVDFPLEMNSSITENTKNSSSTTKLLLTNDDIVSNSEIDFAFSIGFINQYISLTKSSTINDILGEPLTVDKENIMNNFINNENNRKNTSKLDFVNEDNSTRKLFNFDNSNNEFDHYENYKKLEDKNQGYEISNYVKLKSNTNNKNKRNNSVDKFIFARGKDGVYVIAIDGSSYYLSADKERDIQKQRDFLLFRSLYDKLNFVDDEFSYSFDVFENIKNYFLKNPALNLFKVFKHDIVKKEGSFLKSVKANQKMRENFEYLSDLISDYVNSMEESININTISDNIDKLRTKIYERTSSYLDNDKNEKSYDNGIAAKLPNQQVNDGSFPTLEYYYLNILENNGTRKIINNKLDHVNQELKEASKSLIDRLITDIKLTISSNYSQVITLKIDNNKFKSFDLSLSLNLALNNAIKLNPVTNSIKFNFFKNDTWFTNFYDLTEGKITANSYDNISEKIKIIANYYYAQKIMDSEPINKTAYGVPKDFKGYKEILEKIIEDQNYNKNLNNDATIDYFSYLYTFDWLIRDNLKNFKKILDSQIFIGNSGIVSWTIPISVDTEPKSDIFKFDKNANYYWGGKSNWLNNVNQIQDPSRANNLKNPYYATNITAVEDAKFGFNGLSVHGDNKTNSDLEKTLYSNFADSKLNDQTISSGALYAYGSERKDVIDYVEKNLTTNTSLDKFIQFLAKIGINGDFFSNSTDVDNKKRQLIDLLKSEQKINNDVFERYEGYIGNNKTNNITELISTSSADGKRLLPTEIKQINYIDVKNMGDSNWESDNKARSRLGLNLDEFLSIIALQALDTGIQSQAINSMIATNSKVKVGDKRLLDALTQRWSISSIDSNFK